MSTPQRRSPARPRLSLGHESSDTSSTPNPPSRYTSSQRPPLLSHVSGSSNQNQLARKVSLGQPHPSRSSTTFNGSPSQILKSAQKVGSSPLSVQSATPSMAPLTSSQKVVTGDDLEVGDPVDVPGGMHGTIKFIGEVRGKKGVFAGVELSREFAARGKNDGDVDGTRYFTTSIPGSGIFLPSNKAFKRASPTESFNSSPPTPTTPSLAAFNLGGRAENNSQATPTPVTSRFSQSVGPGRAPSPALKPRSRPSLPRPESPLRKAQNATSTPTGRTSIGAPRFSKPAAATPRYAPSPTPGKTSGSVRGMPGDPSKRTKMSSGYGIVKAPQSIRPGSRSQSRLGPEAMFDEEPGSTPIGIAKTSDNVSGTASRSRPVSGQDDEIQRLKRQLAERDKQLEEQSASLAEMENSVAQLQTSIPSQTNGVPARGSRGSGVEDADVLQLRILVREKNEKIAMLTADFDAHRADFRSTIDTLELASTETERVYERKVEELTQEIRELQDRGDDVENVAQQLKQLEELVQELEEGLEDARRGEAEARGEVEFLRGEVERGRSELKREREKAAAALKGAGAAVENGGSSKEVEQRDDEIRGLKAIIHSLSRDAPDSSSPKSGSRRLSRQRNSALHQGEGASDDQIAEERNARERLELEVKELEGLVDRKTYREEELEHEIERLRALQKPPSSGSNGYRSPQSNRNSSRIGKEAMSKWHQSQPTSPDVRTHNRHPLEPMAETDNHSTITDASNLWCEICETTGHDILTCTSMFNNSNASNRNGNIPGSARSSPNAQRTGKDAVIEGLKGLAVPSPHPDDRPAPLSPAPKSTNATPKAPMPNPMDQDMVAGKASGVVDASKWCALCERDGHESVDCPFEDSY